MTDSKLIGRYVKWNIDAPVSMPNGEVVSMQGKYTKILKIEDDSHYKVEIWGTMIYDRIDNGQVTLMPEGFDPNAKIVETKSEYVPKGTKFDEFWVGRKFTCSNFFGINCNFPYHGIIESSGDFSQFQKEKCVGRYSWNSIIECEDFKWITSTDSSKPPATTKLLYKRGDILVSLASVTSGFREVGSLHLCHKDVTSAKAIHYTSIGRNETSSDKVDEFRLATPEETAFYHKGGRNIKDLVIDKAVDKKSTPEFKEGDILVSLKEIDEDSRLEGSLLRFIKFEYSLLHYWGIQGGERNTYDTKTFRKATAEEAELYHQGFKNIKDANSISGFVVGNWYTSSNWNKGSYAKFRKKEGCKFYYYESIFCETHRIKKDFWDLTKDVVLADMKEVSKYLPDGHPDKIVEPSNTVRDMIITEHDGVKVGDKLDIQILNAWMRAGNQWTPEDGFHKSYSDFGSHCSFKVDEITLEDFQHVGRIKNCPFSFRIEGYRKFESVFYKDNSSYKITPDGDELKIGMMISGEALNDWCRQAENEWISNIWQRMLFGYAEGKEYRVNKIEGEYFKVKDFNAGVRIKGFMSFYTRWLLTKRGFDVKEITIKTPAECSPPKVFDEDEYKRQPFNQELTINKLTKQKQKLVL